MKTSLPPRSCAAKPNPFSMLYHLTEPRHSSVGPAPGRGEEGRGEGRPALLITSAVLVSTSRTSATCGPFGPWLIRTFRRAPSGTVLWPVISNARAGRNASDPPTTVTNPKPLSALNHLTLASTDSEPRVEVGLGLKYSGCRSAAW